jgi:hypothetical protein
MLALCFLASQPLHGQSLTLAEKNHSSYTIVLATDASPSEVFAADELQRCVHLATGVRIPVIREDEQSDGPWIIIGFNNSLCPSLGLIEEDGELDDQGFVIRTLTPHLFIGGTRKAGTLYGVFHFLQDYMGIRWYAPGMEDVPQTDCLVIPELHRKEQPAFKWRHTSYAWPGKDDLFLARMGDNEGAGQADRELGIQYTQDGTCHSYFRFLSPSEFFDSHPEYFSEIGGVRRRHETQLCLSNPDVLDIVTERMLQRMESQPDTAQHNFSQMDYYNYCECEKCSAINEQYGTSGGTQYWFLNQLAERTSAVYPEKLIGTLAYMYTEEVPRGLELHPNIAVWLCHMFPSCDSHSIDSCPLNEDFKEGARKWAALSEHLYIWHYIVNFVHYYSPFPNFGALASDLRFYRDLGVEGIYLQGMGHRGGGGEFSMLRPWYVMKLAWNPDLDEKTLMQDFLKGYYGKAWEPIYTYISLLQDKVDRENIHMHLYTNPAQGYLPDEILQQSSLLFDEAEKLAGEDETLLERVRVCRMPLQYAMFFPRNGYRIEEEQLIFNEPLASLDDMSNFLDRLKNHGFDTVREVQGDPSLLFFLALAFSSPLHAPTISSDFIELTAVPFLGGRALRIHDKQTGLDITGLNLTRNLFFPFCGGEELRIGGQFDPEGLFFQFEVLAKSPDSLTLQAEAGEWLVTREFSLHPDKAAITFRSTVKNLSAQTREAILHSHSNIMLGALDKFSVSFTDREGMEQTRQAPSIIAGLREGEKYRDRRAPKSEWILRGEYPLEIVQAFQDEELDFAWLYAYPDYLNDLEAELWAKPALLEQGEEYSFSMEWEIRHKNQL